MQGFVEQTSELPPGKWIYRGQIEGWELESTLERRCKEWGYPDRGIKRSEIERKILRDFQRHPEVRDQIADPGDDLAWLALMQHHGAPTRLLDFTYSPYVALYFALEYAFAQSTTDILPKRPVVWAINTKSIDKWMKTSCRSNTSNTWKKVKEFSKGKSSQSFKKIFIDRGCDDPFVYPVNPLQLNQRLSIQQGLFLCSNDIDRDTCQLLKDMKGVKVRKYLIGLDRNHLEIHGSSRIYSYREWFTDLHRMNLNRYTLYGGLDAYAGNYRWQLPRHAEMPV